MELINPVILAIRKYVLTMPFSENNKGDVGVEFHPSHRMATFKRVITFKNTKVIVHHHSKRQIFSVTYIFADTITLQISMHGDTVYPCDIQIKIGKAGNPLITIYTETLNHLNRYIDDVNEFFQGRMFSNYLGSGMFYYTIPVNVSFRDESFRIE